VIELIGDARLQEPRLASRAGRLAARDDLRSILEQWTLSRTKTDVYQAAQARGIPVGLVADVADLVASPQYAARSFWDSVDHPTTGPVIYPGVPCTMDGVRPTASRSPFIGEHNQAIYQERLGLTAQDLVRLRERGIV